MPQRSVYIKEEDDAKWKALPNKAEFIHKALNANFIVPKNPFGEGIVEKPLTPIVNKLNAADNSAITHKSPTKEKMETPHQTFFKSKKLN